MPVPDDTLSITVGGLILSGWQQVRLTRGIERFPSDFSISLTERYPGAMAEPG